MRFPKNRGSKQINRSQIVKPVAIGLGVLRAFDAGSIVGPGQLKKRGYLMTRIDTVKLIGKGKLEHAYTVRVHSVTTGARSAVEEAGGKIEIISA
jgi:large subunit ribosomal protein L15